MISGKKVSVVVSVFNEEKTVAGVIEALLKSKKIDETICVNDGSADDSLREINRYKEKAVVINFKKNKGKGAAMAAGVKKAKGEVVIFCDSDLVDLKAEGLEKLASLLVKSGKKAILGQPRGRAKDNNMFCSLVGQRAYWRSDLLTVVDEFKNSRLGVETYLNNHFPDWEIVDIDAYHLEKYEKMPINQAGMQYLKEGLEIIKTKAKLKGLWNEDMSRQLDSLYKYTDMDNLEKRVKEINNKYIKGALLKYLKNYMNRIGDLVKRI